MTGKSDKARKPDAAHEFGADVLRALHEARVRAELAAADRLLPGSDSVSSAGAHLATIVVVKGLPGPAEASGKPAMSGADGEAARKALGALGWEPDAAFFTLSRPGSSTDASRRATRLRFQIEAVDPEFVLAVDTDAAADVAEALGLERLPLGTVVRSDGRRVLACDGLEASLSDGARKQLVWSQLKLATPPATVY